jgi:hypothetical protein
MFDRNDRWVNATAFCRLVSFATSLCGRRP